jgi:hypothetical protein
LIGLEVSKHSDLLYAVCKWRGLRAKDLYEILSPSYGLKRFYKILNKLEEKDLIKTLKLWEKGDPKLIYATDLLINSFFNQFKRIDTKSLFKEASLSSFTRAVLNENFIKEVVFSWEREGFERLMSKYRAFPMSVLEGIYRKKKFNIGCTFKDSRETPVASRESFLSFSDDNFFSYILIFFNNKKILDDSLKEREALNKSKVQFNSKKFIFILSDSKDFSTEGAGEWMCIREKDEFFLKELFIP